MTTDPGQAQDLLAGWGGDVKMPIFIEANIHGDEEEGADAMLQIIRDLVTTPYGEHPAVDLLLDHAILVVIPSQNPDGRFLGQRANGNSFDMNRDLLVQSQAEIKANVQLQLEWLAPVMLAMHGYVQPTLIDGLTKPHNPGLEYDIFPLWNQRRLDANVEDYAAAGRSLTIPVRDYGANGGQQANVNANPGSIDPDRHDRLGAHRGDRQPRSGRRPGIPARRRERVCLRRLMGRDLRPGDQPVHVRAHDVRPAAGPAGHDLHRQPGRRRGLG